MDEALVVSRDGIAAELLSNHRSEEDGTELTRWTGTLMCWTGLELPSWSTGAWLCRRRTWSASHPPLAPRPGRLLPASRSTAQRRRHRCCCLGARAGALPPPPACAGLRASTPAACAGACLARSGEHQASAGHRVVVMPAAVARLSWPPAGPARAAQQRAGHRRGTRLAPHRSPVASSLPATMGKRRPRERHAARERRG